ncbi:OB-fold domain-containing protein [Sphingopyxis sp.]|uniref:OB-fold domain-containing protein n=1 Tax=Sphingopyxis sp. TaxID=1908224 RepID=UPI003D0F7A94
MAARAIIGMGGYLPLLRLDRAAAAKALRFSGLGGRGAGYRGVASWDEDALTLAVEAARLTGHSSAPDTIVFASTSAPFTERSHATLLSEALSVAPQCRTNDVAGSRRCGVSALLDALLGTGEAIVAAGEQRAVKAGNPMHFSFGDGGAAARVGDGTGAVLVGHASLAHDLIDIYASRERPEPYAYEERFVKDTATKAVIAPTIKAALAGAGVEPGDITHAAVHEPLAGMWRDIAKATGITAPNHASALAAAAGDLGAAHILFALGLALDAANIGDKILVAGFGSGCDALVLEVTGPVAGAASAAAALKQGLAFADYVRFLSLTKAIDLDWGVRSEFEQKAQATVIERYGRDMIGFIGGRDSRGNVQFPKSPIPIHPDATGPEALEDVRMADLTATLVSVTADRLNFTPAPPFWFGLVQFENGARVMMELTDADAEGFAVGAPLTMRLRIKSHDKRRGFRTYFWKAAPAARPAMEG